LATLLALYSQPSDPEKFDDYYFNHHLPLVKKIQGLLSVEVSMGQIAVLAGTGSYLVATLKFDSLAAIGQALESNAGQAAANDLRNFAAAGVNLMMFDDKEL
jgi:uncharacterized protein (TIGR02118 family)